MFEVLCFLALVQQLSLERDVGVGSQLPFLLHIPFSSLQDTNHVVEPLNKGHFRTSTAILSFIDGLSFFRGYKYNKTS